jgi:hypothetical protein
VVNCSEFRFVLFFLCSLSFFAALIEATRRDRAFDFTGDGEGDRDDSIDGHDDKDELISDSSSSVSIRVTLGFDFRFEFLILFELGDEAI